MSSCDPRDKTVNAERRVTATKNMAPTATRTNSTATRLGLDMIASYPTTESAIQFLDQRTVDDSVDDRSMCGRRRERNVTRTIRENTEWPSTYTLY